VINRKPVATATPITQSGSPVSAASCHASGSRSVSATTSIVADAIASHPTRRLELRRASHAPASVDTDTSSTASHAPAPGDWPSCRTGSMARTNCVESMRQHLLVESDRGGAAA
jgi:hypothetical protein